MPNYAQKAIDALREGNQTNMIEALLALHNQYDMYFIKYNTSVSENDIHLFGAEEQTDVMIYELLNNTDINNIDCRNVLARNIDDWGYPPIRSDMVAQVFNTFNISIAICSNVLRKTNHSQIQKELIDSKFQNELPSSYKNKPSYDMTTDKESTFAYHIKKWQTPMDVLNPTSEEKKDAQNHWSTNPKVRLDSALSDLRKGYESELLKLNELAVDEGRYVTDAHRVKGHKEDLNLFVTGLDNKNKLKAQPIIEKINALDECIDSIKNEKIINDIVMNTVKKWQQQLESSKFLIDNQCNKQINYIFSKNINDKLSDVREDYVSKLKKLLTHFPDSYAPIDLINNLKDSQANKKLEEGFFPNTIIGKKAKDIYQQLQNLDKCIVSIKNEKALNMTVTSKIITWGDSLSKAAPQTVLDKIKEIFTLIRISGFDFFKPSPAKDFMSRWKAFKEETHSTNKSEANEQHSTNINSSD